jgi:D-sedoheptulose 7-phosphate isomerase
VANPNTDGATAGRLSRYFDTLGQLAARTGASDRDGRAMNLGAAYDWVIAAARTAHGGGNRIFFIGNGGSAAIASHMAIDFSNAGKLRATALNDAAVLTCLGNDYGYDQVFARQIEIQARAGDLLVAISSSGRSPSILNGVAAARARVCHVLTLSGFTSDNPLRALGDINLHVPSAEYNFVEVTHMALLAALVDLSIGWGRMPAG